MNRGYRRPATTLPDGAKVIVCASCLTAICSQRVQPCAARRSKPETPSTTRTVKELRKLAREHHSFWQGAPHGFR